MFMAEALSSWRRITNEGLPSSLGRLPHLKAIGLKKNRLTSVPRLLGSLRSLQEIYLEDNDELEVFTSAWALQASWLVYQVTHYSLPALPQWNQAFHVQRVKEGCWVATISMLLKGFWNHQ